MSAIGGKTDIGQPSTRPSSMMEPKFRLCIPNDVSNGQVLGVVVNYMHNHPEQLNQVFSTVALSALAGAWPCR
jgi:hypothetical protein